MFFFSSFVLFFSSNVQRFLNQDTFTWEAKWHKIRRLVYEKLIKIKWVYDFYSPLIYIYIYLYIYIYIYIYIVYFYLFIIHLFICLQHIMPWLYEFKIFCCNLRLFRPSFVGGATNPETLILIMWSQHACPFEETHIISNKSACTPLLIWLESLSHLSRHGFKHTFQK